MNFTLQIFNISKRTITSTKINFFCHNSNPCLIISAIVQNISRQVVLNYTTNVEGDCTECV